MAGATPPRLRADAQRSVERLLDAAVDALADDLDASMSAIARRAGVARATAYAHFPTRDALLDAVSERAFAEVVAVIDAAEPERGTPLEALRRIVAATWRTLGRYQALVAINTAALPPAGLERRHAAVLGRLLPVIERGQEGGAFRADVPPRWHLAMVMTIIHGASAQVRAGVVADDDAEEAVVATVLGALRR